MFCFVLFLNTGVEFLWAYWWLSGKEPTCNAAGVGSIPGSGRSPGEGNANSLQYSCLGKSHGQQSLVGYGPWGHRKSDVT